MARDPGAQMDGSRPPRASEFIYDQLKELIISNQIRPGEKLTEGFWAARWKVSRTPLRTAFTRLEREGFVQILPHRHCVVTDITPEYVRDIHQVREALEVATVRLAVPLLPQATIDEIERTFQEIQADISGGNYESYINSDEWYHSTILNYSPNVVMNQYLSQVFDHVSRIRNISHSLPGEHMREAFHEHMGVLSALQKRDPEGAEIAMRDHLRGVSRRAIGLICEPRVEE